MPKRFSYLPFLLLVIFQLCTTKNVKGVQWGEPTNKISDNIGTLDSMTISGCDSVLPSPTSIRSASITSTDAKHGQVLINFNTVSDKYLQGYVIFRSTNSGPFIEIDTFLYKGRGIYQYFDNGLNTARDTFSYYFESYDSCGNVAMPADTHTVVHITAKALNEANLVSWNLYKGFPNTDYVIYRKTNNGAWNKIAILNGATTTFYDSNVYCHNLYTYQLLAQNVQSGVDSSYSNFDTATAFKTSPPQNPQIINATVTVTSNTLGQIRVNWFASATEDVENYVLYRRLSGTAWQQIAVLPNSQFSFTNIDLNTNSWPYYYKLQAIDSCGNASADSSNYHRTVNLKAIPENGVITLNWNTYKGFFSNRYELFKNGNSFKVFDSTVTSFRDSFVACPNAYNYVIKAIGSDTSALSNRDSTVPIDTVAPLPPEIKDVSVSIPNSAVDIEWRPSLNSYGTGYKIYRTVNGGANQLIAQNNSMDSSYTDTIQLSGAPVCFEIVSYDHCGNSSEPSNQGCIINLNGDSKSLQHELNWNRCELWKDSVAYYNIYRSEDHGGWIPIAQIPSNKIQYIDTLLADTAKNFCYRVEAVETSGGFGANAWSTEICLSQPPIVYIPNAFTPNYSFTLNDYFGPMGIYFHQYSMKIIDRWGEIVYETTTGKPWDGRFKGQPALTGLYQYQIEVQGYNGNLYYFGGTVDIVN